MNEIAYHTYLPQFRGIRSIQSGIKSDAASELHPLPPGGCHKLTLRKHMAAELKRKGSRTIVLAMHPGEVAT